ncbi:glycosyltransferase family 2 protein [Modestobacter sp. VKM Ac-2984]|uniref:glycosyltransferase family 2 protein n=1 Tax=Modestobacter sp. VKM Ac-2984 TaxID=3004138 RepID=UPI0022AA2D1D|nr:glycosyltransferase family A protein [Modestobacter sp. VKM Ac-2984]MCZ2817752.1 glycosyltransferase family A protein [Modestobacter sp. VKM Ac-2984]
MTAGRTPSSVTVAVLTFRRPETLAALLPELVEQAAEVAGGGGARVLVVDNDPAGSGRRIVEDAVWTGSPGVGVDYVHEPTPGIAAGRNRALAESDGSEFLVFIDDDELPHPGWLRHLLATQRDSGAAAVAGTVTSRFPAPLPTWIAAGGFFDRRRLPTGTPLDVAATNNLLLHLPRVRAAGLRFDPAFGLSGGEDTLFTRQLAAAGGALVWCAEAVVTDVVPVERARPEWVLRRAFSSGNSVTRVALVLARGRRGRLVARAQGWTAGGVRVLGGAARWALGVVTADVRHRARGARSAARGAGMLAGTVGHAYQEYGTPVRGRAGQLRAGQLRARATARR